MPKISIIIPVYNVEKYLRQCIDSVLALTNKDIEVILVDDGSTDLSGKICDEYRAKDSRVKVVHKPNGGLVSARKAGFEISRGEYILNLDGDDWIEPDHIESLYNCAIENNADIVSCDYFKDYDDHVEIHSNKPKSKDTEEIVKQYLDGSIHAGVVFRLFKRSLYNNKGFHFPPCDFNEDLHQTTTLTLFTKRVYHVPKATYHYRINNLSLTQKKGATNRLDKYEQYIKNMEDLLPFIEKEGNDKVFRAFVKGINERKRGLIVLNIEHDSKVKELLRYFPKSFNLLDSRNIGDVMFWLASRFQIVFPYKIRYYLKRFSYTN